MNNNNMNDKKRSLRMRNMNDELIKNRFGVIKNTFYIPVLDFSNKTITTVEIDNFINNKRSFINANFRESNLNGITFKNIDLTGAKFIKANLNNVTFKECNLTKAVFSSAKLKENISFINCNLSNSFFVGSDTELYGVTFESCTLTAINFSEANLYTKIIKPLPSDNIEDFEYIYRYTSFVNIDKFNNALFKKAKLYGVTFVNCNLAKADFSEAELTFIRYEDENEDENDDENDDENEEYTEEYTRFNNVNLEEANFTSASLYTVRFVNNVYLKKVNFTKAYLNLGKYSKYSFSVYLEDTSFVSAVIKKVDFSYANYFPEDIDRDSIFFGLDFSNANLEDITFASRNRNDYPAYLLDPTTKQYAKLPEVNFSGAYLLNVDLSYSNLTDSNFSKAILQTLQTDDYSYDSYYINFDNTNFTRANLSGAKIINDSEKYYIYTIFDGANLENASFYNCYFDMASVDGYTILKGVSGLKPLIY